MAKNKEYHDYVVYDLMGNIPGISSRAMFGGFGIYKDGVIFAIIADDQLYFKVRPADRAEFEALGSEPFIYEGHRGKSVQMPYWSVPEGVLEDREALIEWVGRVTEINS